MTRSPAARWLFAVGKFWELQRKGLETFHYVVIRLIWILQRVKLYCATDISFLCTSTKHPDVENDKNLKRLVCCMNQTIIAKRIIGENNLQEMQTCANSYHVVHKDMMGHTGVVSTFCIGVLTTKSSKQNMNSIS